MNKRLYNILKTLKQSDIPLTSEKMAKIMGVSSRTIKNDILQINHFFENRNIHISAKPNLGYQLEVLDEQEYLKMENELDKKKLIVHQDLPQYAYQRVDYIIKKLLVVDFPIRIDDLLEELFISKSTLYFDLKEVKSILGRYFLSVDSIGNSGIMISGEEFSKRLCIVEYFFHNHVGNKFFAKDNIMFNNAQSRNEIILIKELLVNTIDKYKLHLSDLSIENLTIHIVVLLRRIVFDNYIEIINDDFDKTSVEYYGAKDLICKLEASLDIMIPKAEIEYVAMHLKSKHIDENAGNQSKNSELKNLLLSIFDQVKTTYQIDFVQDSELMDFLLLHIPLMIQRIRMHLVMRNPLAISNITKYLYASQISSFVCEHLCQSYDIDIDINEFGYLILYFNLVIQRIKNKRSYRIALACGRGRVETITFLNVLRETYGYVMQNVEIIDIYQIKDSIFDDYDLIITSVPIEMKTKTPIVMIQEFNQNNMMQIDHAIYQLKNPDVNLKKYLKEEHFISHIKGNNKKEILDELKVYAFYAPLFSNDNDYTLMDVCNGGIIVRNLNVKESFIMMAIFNKPVVFHKELVKFIISIQCSDEDINDLSGLCNLISAWLNNEENVQTFIKKQTLAFFEKQLNNIQVK